MTARWNRPSWPELAATVEKAGLWDDLATDWLCLDTELLPWSAKAMALLETQYAPVGCCGHTRPAPGGRAIWRNAGQGELAERTRARGGHGHQPIVTPIDVIAGTSTASTAIAWRRSTCWPTRAASTWTRDHLWHLDIIDRLCAADADFIKTTQRRIIDLAEPTQVADATAWWAQETSAGMEGMVVKPMGFTLKGAKGLIQPGIKCRGREYLRIIYGAEYTAPGHLSRLKARNVGGKRTLAQREYALGFEALKRFVAGEPLHRVHEAVFGVLALESEPVDPRL